LKYISNNKINQYFINLELNSQSNKANPINRNILFLFSIPGIALETSFQYQTEICYWNYVFYIYFLILQELNAHFQI